MSDRFGISGGGRSAEDLFRQMTGAGSAERAAQGDALLDGYPVEVKRATSVTLNQVRALKYLPIVVHYAPADDWYVVPAHVVVAGVSQKRRGHPELRSAMAGVLRESRELADTSLERVRALLHQLGLGT